MILTIDTVQDQGRQIVVQLKDQGRKVACQSVEAEFAQAEKLLPLVEELLKAQNIQPSALAGIEVRSKGGGFTALRIGVATANALAYAWQIPVVAAGQAHKPAGRPFSVVKPEYGQEPNINLT